MADLIGYVEDIMMISWLRKIPAQFLRRKVEVNLIVAQEKIGETAGGAEMLALAATKPGVEVNELSTIAGRGEPGIKTREPGCKIA